MAARFDVSESLDQAFARVAAEEAAAVRAALAIADDIEEAVHRARRNIKRVRALLRLARPALGKRFARANHAWRDAAYMFAGERDSAVALRSFDRVAQTCHDDLPPEKVAAIRECLMASAAEADQLHTSSADATKAALDLAESATARLEWPRGRADLEAGLRRAQQRLRQSWKRARRQTDAENMHEWRKRLKDVAAQTGLLRNVLSKQAARRRVEMQELAEVLGEEHDLAILCRKLDELGPSRGTKTARDRLMRAAEQRQGELRRSALEKAEALTAEAPKAFAREIAGRWSRAHGHARKQERRSRRGRKSAPPTPRDAAGAA
jgi:CHAD domain-containing protein